MNDITLAVNGNNFSGWEEVKVRKSIDGLVGSFSLAVSDKYPGKISSWGFSQGDVCMIKIDGKNVIKGYIEDIDMSYGEDSHSIVISGRDTLCDLVDCSYDYDSTTWKNSTLYIIVKQLVTRYGIGLIADSLVSSDAYTVVPKFVANPIDDVIELLTQLCLHKAILLCSYGDGNLTLTRAGGNGISKESLILGNNILEGSVHISDRDRYSEYTVIGQGTSDEQKSLSSYIEPVGRATDNIVSRNRHLVDISDRATDTGECIKLAEWESRIRAGKSRKYIYKVQGWLQSSIYGGDLWDINKLVQVKDDFLSITDTLLISGLTFNMNLNSGTTTILELVHPDTYKLLEQAVTIRTDFDDV